MATTSASLSTMRSSTSRCFIAASRLRIASRRSASFARIAVFMSSVICSLSVMGVFRWVSQYPGACAKGNRK